MANVGGIDLTGATIAAFGTLLVYDYLFVTFDREVRLVWPTRWTAGKVLFFLNRYLPFIDTFLSLHLLTGRNTNNECLFGFKAVTWLIVVGIIIAETILMMRTYALWGRSRKILITLVTLWFCVCIPAAVITQLEADSFVYAAADVGCTKTVPSSPIIFVAFLLLIISETAIVVLTVIRAVRHREHRKSILLVRMYQDGLLYYLYLFAFSLVNLLIAVAAPSSFANWLTTPQRVLHSILCTRVLLHIRESNSRPDTSVAELSTALSFEQVKGRRRSKTTGGYGGVSQGTESSGSGSGSGITTSTTTNTTTTASDTSTGLSFAGTGSGTDSETYASFMNWDGDGGRVRNARRRGKEREREDRDEGSSRSGQGRALDSAKKFGAAVFAFKPSRASTRSGTPPDAAGVGPSAADGGGEATRQTRSLTRTGEREGAIVEEEIEMNEPSKVAPERERMSPQDAV